MSPLLPGTGLLAVGGSALRRPQRIGYPVMLKSTAGGGGIGMRLCRRRRSWRNLMRRCSGLSQANFGNGGLYLEKFVANARHIEVQIFGDGSGNVIALGERDCSAQRRNQKVIEETPAPGLCASDRARKCLRRAVRLGESGAAINPRERSSSFTTTTPRIFISSK